jgi:3-deoxy-D-manno-octulosonic acid kinase
MHALAGGEWWKGLRDDMRLECIATAGGAILYDPSRVDHPADADFDPAALARAGRVRGAADGRGRVWFVTGGGGEWVLRHYRRGGLAARLVADRYLWAGAAATRSFRELRLLALLEQLDLPAARPVAARYRRAGFSYRADLLTAAIPGARSLAASLGEGLPPPAWRAVGACVREFHDAGICHADLNAHNVLLDADGRVYLVDFDRGRRRAPGAWRARNLARLRHSLAKLATTLPARGRVDGWAELEAGYGAPRARPPR